MLSCCCPSNLEEHRLTFLICASKFTMISVKRLALLDIGSKVLCILLLVMQCALLDNFFIKFDKDNPGKWVWIAGDVIVIVIWIAGLVLTSRNLPTKHSLQTNVAQKCLGIVVREVHFAYFSWIFYAIVLIAKVWFMFGDFAENLTTLGYYTSNTSSDGLPLVTKFEDTLLYSSTSLKVILSIAGPLFLLLAYAHHDEIHNSKYKLQMEKLGSMASLDVLDSLSLLGLLFIDNTRLLLPFSLDHAIRVFTCCCFILPVIPLIILRIMGKRKAEDNNLKIILIVNSALYLILVNVPFLCIRCFLWFKHDIDISTFITKNVMCLFRGGLDIYNESKQWLKARQGEVATDGTETCEPGIELSNKPTAI